MTPLSLAVYLGRKKMVKELLNQKNIDVMKKNGKNPSVPELAFMTSIKVALYKKNQNIVFLLKNKYMSREWETKTRAELIQIVESEELDDITTTIAGKSESEVREMMSRGEVVTNMWSSILAEWEELQKSAPSLKQERDGITEQLCSISKQITALQQQTEELKKQGAEIDLKLARSQISQQTLETVKVLAKAEQSGEEQLNTKMQKAQQEDTALALEDVGYFLNSLGMARNARKLYLLCNDDPEMAEMSIVEAGVLLQEHVPLGDRLDIQFGIDMVKHKQYPSYQKHWKECAVCRSPVGELLTEYGLKLKDEVLNKEQFSSFGLSFLLALELPLVLRSNSNIERVKASKAIKSMRQNHTNHITEEYQEQKQQRPESPMSTNENKNED